MCLYEFYLFLPTSGRSLNFAGARDVTRQLVYKENSRRIVRPVAVCEQIFLWRAIPRSRRDEPTSSLEDDWCHPDEYSSRCQLLEELTKYRLEKQL
ncbi:hypothetical protein DPMN_129451 [Dreissena polymorpha]|uniref:Uncharacterized protein n=1 Tax=Dreissena polymorpha TaxID=45954 RepID=A0A9D4H2S6_DREPO|nr:hypothetical protein DPMN_129451 [Dreissena polymorpha]